MRCLLGILCILMAAVLATSAYFITANLPFDSGGTIRANQGVGSQCTGSITCIPHSYCYLENGNNTCQCNKGYTPSADCLRCLARIGTTCLDGACVPNAFCNLEADKDTCKCEEGFSPSEEMDKCLGNIGTDCSDSECIPNAVCNGPGAKLSCHCEPGRVPSEAGDKCLIRAGGICENDDDCINNSYCSKDGKRCTCLQNFSPSGDTGKCLSKIGSPCQNNDMCIQSAYCYTGNDNNTCQCNDGLNANAAGDACFATVGVGGICSDSAQCGRWGVCADGMCQCDQDHVSRGNGTCMSGLGKPCEVSEDCVSKYSTCLNATCTCSRGYEEKNGLCKGRYNYICVTDDDCEDSHASCKQMKGGEWRCGCEGRYHYSETKGSCTSAAGSYTSDTISATLLSCLIFLFNFNRRNSPVVF